MYRYVRNMIIWTVIIGVVVYVFLPLYRTSEPREELAYSRFLTLVEEGQIVGVTVNRDTLLGQRKNGDAFVTNGPMNETLLAQLRAKNAVVVFAPEPRRTLLPYAALAGAFLFGVIVGAVIKRGRRPGDS